MRLAKQCRQLAKQRVPDVGLVAHLIAQLAAPQQAGARQLIHLTRQRTGVAASQARQLTQVKRDSGCSNSNASTRCRAAGNS